MSLLAALSCALSAAETPAVFRAGAAMLDITPSLGVSIVGNLHDQKARYIHDPLHARCLALDDGEAKLVFVLVDNCLVPRAVFDEAKRRAEAPTGIPASHMLMAATHTHSGPAATPVFQSDPEPAYLEFLSQRIADAVQCALHNLAPARIAWGRGNLPPEVHNRRWRMKPEALAEDPFGGRNDTVRMNPPSGDGLIEPAGPTDPEVSFIAAQGLDGRPVALLANYSLHYVGGVPGDQISADYFAVFAERIRALLGAEHLDPPFVGLLSNGTSGDVNNIRHESPEPPRAPYEQISRVANLLADEIYRVYPSIEWRTWVPLRAATRELELGVRRPSEAEIERARAIMASAKGPAMTTMPEIYARETVLLAEYPKTVPLLIQALRIGDLGIVGIPCEVFAELGLQLKKESPFPATFTIELANGYNGYLPTEAQHALGGYETWRARSSYLETNAASKIVATALDLLREVK